MTQNMFFTLNDFKKEFETEIDISWEKSKVFLDLCTKENLAKMMYETYMKREFKKN